ncbi:thiol reductant ABC exporter subunit CydD [Teichococcus aerofrigidensis]
MPETETSAAALKPAADRAIGRWLTGLRRQAGAALPLAVLAPLLGGGLLVLQAWLLATVLDHAIAGGAAAEALLPGLLSIGALIAARALLSGIGEAAGARAAERIKLALRRRLFADLLARRPDWTAARSSGALAAALVEQVEALDGFFSRFLPAMVQAALLPLAFAVVILPVDWVAGLLFLLTAPLVPLFMALVGWGAEAASRRQAQAFARLSGYFADRLRGLVTLRLFGRAEAETAAVRDAAEALRQRSLAVLRIAFLSSAVLELFAALGVAGIALYVGLSYLGLIHLPGTALTLQTGLFCLLMAPEVYQPLRLLAAHYHDRANARAGAAEIEAVLGGLPVASRPATVAAPPTRPVAPPPRSAIAVAIEDLVLDTPDGGRRLLDHAGLRLAAGGSLAILGASGIGKSSLLEALAGLRAAEGRILLGGVPLEALDEAKLRARVAILGQRPRIFQGSIADNLRLARPGASMAELRLAAGLADVLGFADALPQGLDTPVGDGGLGLSGGEAQRVALARIFLRNPDILLLDEPTAHLDAATEARVLDGILRFSAGRTLIVATHSTAVAARLERVLRLAGGDLLPAPHPVRRFAPGSAA